MSWFKKFIRSLLCPHDYGWYKSIDNGYKCTKCKNCHIVITTDNQGSV